MESYQTIEKKSKEELPEDLLKYLTLSESDDEYDTDLELETKDTDQSKVKGTKASPSEVYKNLCEIWKLPVQLAVLSQINTESLAIPHRNLGPLVIKPLIIAIKGSRDLERLDLTDNALDEDCGLLLGNILSKHQSMRHVVLCDNKLGREGGVAMGEILVDNCLMITLDLSGNGIDEEAAHSLARGIEVNDHLIALNLSHNGLSGNGAAHFGYCLGLNNSLQRLDLSWNKICFSGAVGILSGLQTNDTLVELDISWNGLGYEGALALSEMLKTNQVLSKLNVSNCHFNWQGAFMLAAGIKQNSTLEVLKIGHNPLTTTGCMDILEAISGSKSGITHLDLTCVPVIGEFEIMARTLQKVREFTYVHGGIVRSHDLLGQRHEKQVSPMQRVIDYMRERELRPTELFRDFDKDVAHKLTKKQMIQRIKKTGIPLMEHEVDMLLDHFEKVMRKGDSGAKPDINYQTLVRAVQVQTETERVQSIAERENARRVKEYHKKIMTTEPPPQSSQNEAASSVGAGSLISEKKVLAKVLSRMNLASSIGGSTARDQFTSHGWPSEHTEQAQSFKNVMSMSRPMGSKAKPFGKAGPKKRGKKKSHKKKKRK